MNDVLDIEILLAKSDIARLSCCCRSTRLILKDTMWKVKYMEKFEENTNKLQEIELSFAGTLGLTSVGQSKACAVSNEDFSYTLRCDDHWPDHWIRLSFSHDAQDSTWFISRVNFLRTRSMVPVLNCPKLEVTICKDKRETYEDCVVQWLQWTNTEDSSTYTMLGNNDKIMVRIEHNEKMLIPNKELPFRINIIGQN